MRSHSFWNSFDFALKGFSSKSGQSAIARRLLISVLLISTIFACLQTAFQIKLDYQSGIDSINNEFDQIERSHTQSLSRSIWEVDTEQIKNIASGIYALPNMAEVRVLEHSGGDTEQTCQLGQFTELLYLNKANSGDSIDRVFPITRNEAPSSSCIGRLELSVSLEVLYKDLIGKLIVMLIFQGIKTFSVSIFVLAIFHHLVTRHLMAMAEFSESTNQDNLSQTLILDFNNKEEDNELTRLADTLNQARANVMTLLSFQREKIDLEHELEKQKEKEKLKEFHNRIIEKKNSELATTNKELTHTIDALESAQGHLVRAERMASLGSMVRGVAHELNTPIGVAATGSTLIQSKITNLSKRYHSGDMTKTDLEGGLETTAESANVVVVAINKASNLIQTFKRVSVEENDDKQTKFELSEHIDQALIAFKQTLEDRSIELNLQLDGPLNVDSFPSAFYQIIVNLLSNSLDHGFAAGESGAITIESKSTGDTLVLTYRDNGRGIDEATLPRIFDPFFTTSDDTEHSGLGLNILYNLITDRLDGTISASSTPGKGTEFTLTFPNLLSDTATPA